MATRRPQNVPNPSEPGGDSESRPAAAPGSDQPSPKPAETSAFDGRFAGITEILGIQPRAETTDPLVGRTIGDVTIGSMIAEGGMSRIYAGRQRSPDRDVAVKVLRPGFITTEGVKRFAREAEILGSSRHPYIAQVYWAGVCDILGSAVPFIVMELVDQAETITDHVESRHTDSHAVLSLFRKVCEAVAQAHAAGIVHRDLKPGNVLIDGLGNPKLIDFGIARLATASAEQTAITECGRLLGTVRYMSPEQLTGDVATIDARSDVYALGLLLHELLTGRLPYSIDPVRIFDAVRIVRERGPISMHQTRDSTPVPGLEEVVKRCLEIDPGARYPDAGRLLEALDGLGGVLDHPHAAAGPSRKTWLAAAGAGAIVVAGLGFLPSRRMTPPSHTAASGSKMPRATVTALHALSDEEARAAQPVDGILTFTGITGISPSVAETLIGRGQRLRIYDLQTVGPELAEIFGRNRRGVELWSVRSVTPESAASLARTGGPLCLDGVTSLDVDSAKALSLHRDWLNLGGLATLPDDVLTALTQHRGHGMAIRVPGTLDSRQAEIIARHRGLLYLLSVDTVTSDAARALAAHRGPIHVDAAHVTPEVDRLLGQLK